MATQPQQTKEWAAAERQVNVAGTAAIAQTDDATLWTRCTIYAKARCLPQCYWDKPNDIFVAVQLGRALGVDDMVFLQNSFVLDGRPHPGAYLLLGVCQRSPVWDHKAYKVAEIGKPFEDGYGYAVSMGRLGGTVQTYTYTVADAKSAKLWERKSTSGKDMPWTLHAKDMLRKTAISKCMRSILADVTMGLVSAEEMDHQLAVERALDAVDLTPRTDEERIDDVLSQCTTGAAAPEPATDVPQEVPAPPVVELPVELPSPAATDDDMPIGPDSPLLFEIKLLWTASDITKEKQQAAAGAARVNASRPWRNCTHAEAQAALAILRGA